MLEGNTSQARHLFSSIPCRDFSYDENACRTTSFVRLSYTNFVSSCFHRDELDWDYILAKVKYLISLIVIPSYAGRMPGGFTFDR